MMNGLQSLPQWKLAFNDPSVPKELNEMRFVLISILAETVLSWVCWAQSRYNQHLANPIPGFLMIS